MSLPHPRHFAARKAPPVISHTRHEVVGGSAGRAFALVLERRWTWPDQYSESRFALLWCDLTTREVRGWRISPEDHRVVVIDEPPERLVVATWANGPMFCIDPMSRQVLWNNHMRRINVMHALQGSRRFAVRLREGGSRLVNADSGTWIPFPRVESIEGSDAQLIALRRRGLPGLLSVDRKITPFAEANRLKNIMSATSGHGLAVIAGDNKVQAYRYDGGFEWEASIEGFAIHSLTLPDGFRIISNVNSRTTYFDIDFHGSLFRTGGAPCDGMVGNDLAADRDGVVLEMGTMAVVYDFTTQIRSCLDVVYDQDAVDLPTKPKRPKRAAAAMEVAPSSELRHVHHEVFGSGQIVEPLEGGKVRVRFETGDERVLLARSVSRYPNSDQET